LEIDKTFLEPKIKVSKNYLQLKHFVHIKYKEKIEIENNGELPYNFKIKNLKSNIVKVFPLEGVVLPKNKITLNVKIDVTSENVKLISETFYIDDFVFNISGFKKYLTFEKDSFINSKLEFLNRDENEIPTQIKKLIQFTIFNIKNKFELDTELFSTKYQYITNNIQIDYLKELESFILNKEKINFENEINSNLILYLCLTFLQCLIEPIIPYKFYSNFISKDLDLNLLNNLPKSNHNTLIYFISFFYKIKLKVDKLDFFSMLFINSILRKKEDIDFTIKNDKKINFLHQILFLFDSNKFELIK
jgi:hypothetical protein